MFYVFKVENPFTVRGWGDQKLYDKIWVRNSINGVEKYYTNAQLYNILKYKTVVVYGTYCYGKSPREMYVFATPIKVGIKVSNKLNDLFRINFERHNPWSLYAIADYLASLKVGTKISITFTDTYEEGRGEFTETVSIEKISDDLWNMNNSWATQGNSQKAAGFIDYPSCSRRKVVKYI